jgi:hypothetical protein
MHAGVRPGLTVPDLQGFGKALIEDLGLFACRFTQGNES